MRWDRLFDDLEAQLAAQARLELDAEVADRTRAERARVTLGERLVGSVGSELTVRSRGGVLLTGRLADSGDGWLLLEETSGRSALVAVAALVSVHGLERRPRDDTRARRFGLGYALRGISRDRRPVVVMDTDGGTAHGTIDVVGADAFDLAEHPLDAPRRAANVRSVRTVPFVGLSAITSG